ATTPDAQFFYVASPIAVYRCPYRGCADPNNPPIWMGAQGLINGIVADANAVYWTDTENGRVMKCPHDTLCNAPVTIASGLSQPWSIAVDDQYVYWTLAGSTTAAVQRAPK